LTNGNDHIGMIYWWAHRRRISNNRRCSLELPHHHDQTTEATNPSTGIISDTPDHFSLSQAALTKACQVSGGLISDTRSGKTHQHRTSTPLRTRTWHQSCGLWNWRLT